MTIDEPKLGALRYNEDKPRLSLLPSQPLIEIAKVMTVGARKYDTHNWRLGFEYLSIYDSLQRHLLVWLEGEDLDKETGLSHLAHAGCNILFLLEQVVHKTGKDNRFKAREEYANTLKVISDIGQGTSPLFSEEHILSPEEYWDEVQRRTHELNKQKLFELEKGLKNGTDSKD